VANIYNLYETEMMGGTVDEQFVGFINSLYE